MPLVLGSLADAVLLEGMVQSDAKSINRVEDHRVNSTLKLVLAPQGSTGEAKTKGRNVIPSSIDIIFPA
jgi:hypothetical protein